MAINNISTINKLVKTSSSYNLKTNSVNTNNQLGFKEALDIQRNKLISNNFSNYNIEGFRLKAKEVAANKLSITNDLIEVDSEDPNIRLFTTYRPKVKGSGKMQLDIRIVGCDKTTQIDEKEFESAMTKVISIVDKIEYAFDKIGYRPDDFFAAMVNYNPSTGKIELGEFIKEVKIGLKSVIDEVYGTYSKGKNISNDELKNIEAILEKIKNEMYDFFLKFDKEESINDFNHARTDINPSNSEEDYLSDLKRI